MKKIKFLLIAALFGPLLVSGQMDWKYTKRFFPLIDTCRQTTCIPFGNSDNYQVYGALKLKFGKNYLPDSCHPATCIPFGNSDMLQIYSAIKGIKFGSGANYDSTHAWSIYGNATTTGRKLGTTTNQTFTVITNNNPRLVFTGNGHIQARAPFYDNSDILSANFTSRILTSTGAVTNLDWQNKYLNNDWVFVGSDATSAKYTLKTQDNLNNNIFSVRNDKKIIYTDGSQGAGKVLTSDANGVATWSTTASGAFLPKPQDYGAIGNGIANDSAAVAQWLAAISGAAGYVPPGTYLCNGLTIPANTKIWGYNATFKKNSNGAVMATIAGGVELHDISFYGNGATYSGKGFTITTGNDQKFFNVNIYDFTDYCLSINKDVAIRFNWNGGTVYRHNAITDIPILLGANGAPQESNGDRVFTNLNAAGNWLIDVQYSQFTEVSNCNFVNMNFAATASKTLVVGNRMATLGSDITVKGTQCNVSSNIIAGGITIASGATYNVIDGNTLTTGSTITDNSTNLTNSYCKTWTYTPTWTSSGTNPAIGNGSITGYANKDINGTVTGWIMVQTGSTTTYGSTNVWAFSLPTTALNANTIGGSCLGFNQGVAFYAGSVTGGSATSVVCQSAAQTGNYWNSGNPAAWGGAGNSWIKIYFNYTER